MPTTARGVWYPGSGDSTRIWEHLKQQAESVDAAITAEAAKVIAKHGNASGLVNVAATANSVSFPVAFPNTYDVPSVVAILTGSTSAITTVANVTRSGFTVSARRIDNGSQFTGTFMWIARSSLTPV